MFGAKLRRTVRDAAGEIRAGADRQTHMLDRRMEQQNQQISRQGNAAEIRNDVELMKLGYTSNSDIPRDVRIRCLWEPREKTAGGMTNWKYTEAVVTLTAVTFDLKGAIEDSEWRDQQSMKFLGARIFNELNTVPELKQMELFLKHTANRDTFHYAYERTAHDLKLHYVLRGTVEAYWSDPLKQDFYTQDAPRWWKIEN